MLIVNTFVLFWGSIRKAKNIVNYLKVFNINKQITLETQINNILNFLDLTVNIDNNKFEYSIYRKPTLTKTIIRHDSNHPYFQKGSSFNSILYRLEHIPLSKHNNINNHIVYDIAHNNNFDLKTSNCVKVQIFQNPTNNIVVYTYTNDISKKF